MRGRIVELIERICLRFNAARFPTEYRDEILRSGTADVVSRATTRSAGIIFIEMGICPISSIEPVIWHSVPPLMALLGCVYIPIDSIHTEYRNIREQVYIQIDYIPISTDMRNDGASPCDIYLHELSGRSAESSQWIAIENGSASRLA